MEGRLGTMWPQGRHCSKPNLGVMKAEGSLDGVIEAVERLMVNGVIDDCLGLISSRLEGWAGTQSLPRDLWRKVEVGYLRLTHVSFRNSTLLNGERGRKM